MRNKLDEAVVVVDKSNKFNVMEKGIGSPNRKEMRNVNLEVLRVLAMFLIVAGHYVWTGVKQVMPSGYLDVNDCWGG